MEAIAVIAVVLAFVLGTICGFWLACWGLALKQKTHDLIKGKWVPRPLSVSEMMFGKDDE